MEFTPWIIGRVIEELRTDVENLKDSVKDFKRKKTIRNLCTVYGHFFQVERTHSFLDIIFWDPKWKGLISNETWDKKIAALDSEVKEAMKPVYNLTYEIMDCEV